MDRYTPNTPEVVSEKFEDEIIVVSLVNGNYYSLRGTAAVIWDLIVQGHSRQTIAATLSEVAGLVNGQVEQVNAFFEELIEHALIKKTDGHSADGELAIEDDFEYKAPVLEAYSDMQDLLLLDPIHDVDEETGWPAKPASEEGQDN